MWTHEDCIPCTPQDGDLHLVDCRSMRKTLWSECTKSHGHVRACMNPGLNAELKAHLPGEGTFYCKAQLP